MKKYTLFIFLIISNFSFAQKNFVDGYIILKDNSDTIKVKIDDRNWDINPGIISTKQNGNIEAKYDINELSAFGVYGKEHYLIKKVDLDITPFSTDIISSPLLNIKKDTILALRFILKADYSLLFCKDSDAKEHFFYSDKLLIKELINHKFLVSKDEKMYERHDKRYIKQLDSLFSVCNKTLKTTDLEYSFKDLSDKFIEFNDCMGCSSVCYLKQKEDKNIFKLGICLGSIFNNQYQEYYDPFERIRATDKYFTTQPLIGINTIIYSKRHFGRRSVSVELLYQPFSLTNKYSNHSLKLHFLNINTIYRNQVFLKSKIKPFYGVGLNIQSKLFDNSTSSNSYIYDYAKFSPKCIFEIGCESKHIILSARINYEPFDNSHIYYEFKKVSEVLVNTNYSRISSQLSMSYQF